jgi:Flp pilus assembly pilin Flp
MKRHFKRQRGQSLAEYALILALIAVVCIPMLTTLGTQIGATLTTVAGYL